MKTNDFVGRYTGYKLQWNVMNTQATRVHVLSTAFVFANLEI